MFNSLDQRRKQIDTLKIFNDNVIEVKIDEKYEIKFKSGDNEITLEIELEPEFPYKKPKLTLNPAVSHPWIENNEIVHFLGLVNYSINSDLGRVCQAIIREFEKNPAELASSSPQVKVTHHQSVIPELNSLDDNQLIALLQDDQYLDDFVEELGPLKNLNAELDALIEETEKQSNLNLEKESKLLSLKSSIAELFEEFSNLGSNYNQLSRKYEDKSGEFSPENIRQLLEISVSSAETECDEIVEKFLLGNQNISEFLDDFTKVKKLIALRKFKEERLNYQLRQLKM